MDLKLGDRAGQAQSRGGGLYFGYIRSVAGRRRNVADFPCKTCF